MKRTIRYGTAILLLIPALAQADPNEAFRPYTIPADVGASYNRLLAEGLVTGDAKVGSLKITTEAKKQCVQVVGGVQVEESQNFIGSIDSTTIITGDVVNVCY